MIKTETVWTRTGRTISMTVTDAPVTEGRHGGVSLLPDRVRLEFTRHNDGDWTESYAYVQGHRIKADGTPGKSVSNFFFPDVETMPEWLRELVEYHRPSGAI